jgi:hypothetical protein
VDVAFDGFIRVRRYLCRLCKRTVSLLPEFVLPYLRFSIVVIRWFLVSRLLAKRSLREAACTAAQPSMPYQRGQFWIRRFRSGIIATSVIPEPHEIKVIDKNGESGTMHRFFATGEIAELSKKDFVLGRSALAAAPPPPPALSAEDREWQQVKDSASIAELEKFRDRYPKSQHQGDLQEKLDNLYWEKAKESGTVAAFDEYLSKFPNDKHREEAQEDLAWNKAEADNTLQAFQDYQKEYPQGPHFESAGKKIEDLRFQAARNSQDEAVLQSFLKDYPSGELHDQIYKRLDEVIWERTRKDDSASLLAYISRMPDGGHINQARSELERMSAPKPPMASASAAIDDKAAVREVIDRYNRAYNDRNVEEVRNIWPSMGAKQISNLRHFFTTANDLKATYTIDQEPQVTGLHATVQVTQSLTFVTKTGHKEISHTLVIKLQRAVSSPSASLVWTIDSLSQR